MSCDRVFAMPLLTSYDYAHTHAYYYYFFSAMKLQTYRRK